MNALPPKFLLRWRFEWADRPAKYGMWSHSGTKDDLATKAWCQNHEGLLWAIVEAKDYLTREIKTIVRVPGQDFMNFQWVALAMPPMFGLNGKKITPVTRIGGIKIITRNEEICVHDFGKVTRSPVTTNNLHFATYGR